MTYSGFKALFPTAWSRAEENEIYVNAMSWSIDSVEV